MVFLAPSVIEASLALPKQRSNVDLSPNVIVLVVLL